MKARAYENKRASCEVKSVKNRMRFLQAKLATSFLPPNSIWESHCYHCRSDPADVWAKFLNQWHPSFVA